MGLKWACAIALSATALSAQETPGSISGSIVDVHDAKIPKVAVAIISPSKTETRSDVSGNFVLSHLAPGVYHLRFKYPGFKVRDLEVSVATGKKTTLGPVLLDVTVTQSCLGPAGTFQTSSRKLSSGAAARILGKTRGTHGDAWKYLIVTLTTAGEKPFAVTHTNKNGAFQFLDVAPGVYDLEISQRDVSLINIRTLRVATGNDVRVRVRWAQPQICL